LKLCIEGCPLLTNNNYYELFRIIISPSEDSNMISSADGFHTVDTIYNDNKGEQYLVKEIPQA